MKHTSQQIDDVGRHFAFSGRLVNVRPLGHGHIHDTYVVDYADARGAVSRYTLQRIQARIFPSLDALTGNIHTVTRHVRRALERAGSADLDRKVLTPLRAQNGDAWVKADDGDAWRAYRFIGGAHSIDRPERPETVRAAARAFAAFQGQLIDLPVEAIQETLPGFHDTPSRFARLMEAIEQDTCRRARTVEAECAFAREHEPLAHVLADLHRAGRLPARIVHNDTKINNILFDDVTGEPLCVIDLDTVMPGLALYDFGDLVRTATGSTAEDEPDTSRVRVRTDYFQAITEGYLSVAKAFLTQTEIDYLVNGATCITFETGLRFLTDYLCGDAYFKTSRPGHNLDRARNQFALLRDMEARLEEWQRIVAQACLAEGGSRESGVGSEK